MKMRFKENLLLAGFWCLVLWNSVDAVVNNGKHFTKKYHRQISEITPLHTVSFTQKGYIQFLRYITEVPELEEYTFCIWVKSRNMSYSHPLLSYSKDEKERLIRVWLDPHGTHLNLEILETPIFRLPVHFTEHRWYHVCQSWSSHTASWFLYLDGKLKSSGTTPQLRGTVVKGGGDIVVGQEYTDFDKGLDDGIEGAVSGFNFVLSSTKKKEVARFFENDLFPFYVPRNVYGYFSFGWDRKFSGFSDGRMYFETVPDKFSSKTTGQKLVELSYSCYLGKGAPLKGKDVLISWTKTPVRVFGGAVVKNVEPFCI